MMIGMKIQILMQIEEVVEGEEMILVEHSLFDEIVLV